MKKIIPLIVFCFVLTTNSYTQEIKCKSSESNTNYLYKNKKSLEEYKSFNIFSENFKNTKNNNTLIIPIVFHIYGTVQNGSTVDYDVIVNSLNQVNEEFNGLNADFDTVDSNFDGIKSTLDIEFRLAKLDPDGNCTTGVVFHSVASGQGNYNSPVVAQDNWDNYKYMNVYITADLYGDGNLTNSGVAWYPDSNMSNQGIARVVYNGQYLTGNTNSEFASVLTHEFGHWLNLIHTHDGGCGGTDLVNDTPQENVGGDCNELEDCGHLINYENYMGYNGATGCYKMFTIGQTNRMDAAMNHPARNTLWQTDNLEATGVLLSGATASLDVYEILENIANDGSFNSNLALSLMDVGFNSTGILEENIDYIIDLPEGISATIEVMNSTDAIISFSGNAYNHNESDFFISTLQLLNPAIDGGVSQLICDSLSWAFKFVDPYQIVYVDNSDLTVTTTATWEPFEITIGDSPAYGLWYFNNPDYDPSTGFKFETYGKRLTCNPGTRHITPLGYNQPVNNTNNWVSPVAYPGQLDIRYDDYTDWDGLNDYFGFEYTINGNICYGWFHIQVAANGNSYTLLDYAYNTEPGGTIMTGQILTVPDNKNISNVILFPNPVTNNLNIQFNNTSLTDVRLSLYNVLGQNVYSALINQNSQSFSVNLSFLNKGFYILKIESGNNNIITKSVIKN